MAQSQWRITQKQIEEVEWHGWSEGKKAMQFSIHLTSVAKIAIHLSLLKKINLIVLFMKDWKKVLIQQVIS